MLVDIVFEDTRWETHGLSAMAQAAASATLTHLDIDQTDVEISLLACDDARIASLNGDFREKSQPTNVLSWPSENRAADTPGGAPGAPMDLELGDIAVAYETCAREAKEQDKPFGAHVTHLLVHGVLHLLGYDHIDDTDAALMEGLEVEILGKMGICDPYGR